MRFKRSLGADLYAAGLGVEIGGGPSAWAVGDGFQTMITPTSIRREIEATRGYVDALARDVAASAGRLSEGWKASWTDFLARWGGFLADHQPGVLSDLESSAFHTTRSTLLDYADEARRWRHSFEAAGGQSTANLPDIAPRGPELPSIGPGRSTPGWVWWAAGLAVVAGIAYMKGEG